MTNRPPSTRAASSGRPARQREHQQGRRRSSHAPRPRSHSWRVRVHCSVPHTLLTRSNPSSALATGADRRRDRPVASTTTGVRLAELLGRLSLAFDIANGAAYGKGVRSAVLAVELGRLTGATNEELHDTFWVSLLGYLGCTMSDTSIKLAHIVGAGPRILSALTQLCERGPGEPDAPSGDALSLPTRLVVIAHATEAVLQQHGQAG